MKTINKYIEIVRTANKALLLNIGRTILTMLGVIIGVFAVVSLVSMGIGVQNYVTDQFESIGSNLIFVVPGKMAFSDDPAKALGNIRLREKHADLIETYADEYIDKVSIAISFGDNVEFKNKKYYGTVYGVNEKAKDIFNVELEDGRFLSESEINNKASVAVLSPLIVEELFPKVSPIGKNVKIKENSYEVIGFTKEKAQDFDEVIYIPYSTVMADFDKEDVTSIAIEAKDKDTVDLAIKEVEFALLRDLDKDDFSVMSASDILSSIQNILQILTAGIGAIAGISLIVGGIGIMNIMLVSVTERIKEIGLRKALGATPSDIATQFLFESVMISVGGGLIGLLLGWLASLTARSVVRTEVPLWAVGLAFGFSVLVGVLFGTYPAIKASRKDPIEALRYE